MVVRRAMKFSTIVAGGGAIEMELSSFLNLYNYIIIIFILIYLLDFYASIQEQFKERLSLL